MLDIKFIRENTDLVKQGAKNKNADPALIDQVLDLDQKRRDLMTQVQELRSQRNIAAKEKNIEEGKRIKEELKAIEPQLAEVEAKYEDLILKIPNVPSEEAPVGKDDSFNKVVRTWGEPKKFNFTPKDHMELGAALGIIDTDTSANISGARFNYLMGDAVLLQFALINFAIETLTNRQTVGQIAKSIGNKYDTPFIPVITPVLAKSEIMKKMDRFDPIDDRYYFEQDDLLLIGSAEHTLGPLYMDKTIAQKDLPIRLLGYSTAFRREAGTYGKDTQGILRRHQFDKLEMESFTTPEDGLEEQNLMTLIQEYFMQKLEIPYQIVMISTGDMGKPDFRQVDLESWMPGQDKYRETHTSDYMTDYQSRRLNTKVQIKRGDTEFAHMNDATAFAIGRTLIAILENYQQKDGSVQVPQVLQKWMGKDKMTS
jgi:seryl-tRNA synthetase